MLMKQVYLLRSISHPDQRYIGLTSNIRERLKAHNAGRSYHTSKYIPWEIVAVFAFQDDVRAGAFERYLKTGSGHAFANKHLW